MAADTNTTTRRSALRGLSAAAITAGLAVPAMANPTEPPDADAELIRLCTNVTAIQRKLETLIATRNTVEDERRTEPELIRLYDERAEAMDKITGPPTTLAGCRATAAAAIAIAPRDWNGEISCGNDAEWLAWSVAQWVADAGSVA